MVDLGQHGRDLAEPGRDRLHLAAGDQHPADRQLARRTVRQQGRGVDRVVPGVDPRGRQRGLDHTGPDPLLRQLPLGRPGLQPLAVRQHHRAERRGDQQRAGHLERPDVRPEDHAGQRGDVAVDVHLGQAGGGRVLRLVQHRHQQRAEAEPEQDRGQALTLDRLDQRVAGVDADQHQHEQEQHHHGAGVDEHLHHAQERRVLGQVDDAQVHHHHGHRQRRVHRLAGEHQAERGDHHQRGEHPEQHHLAGGLDVGGPRPGGGQPGGQAVQTTGQAGQRSSGHRDTSPPTTWPVPAIWSGWSAVAGAAWASTQACCSGTDWVTLPW